MARPALADGLRLSVGSAGTVLVRLDIGPIDEQGSSIRALNTLSSLPAADQALKRL